MLRAVSIVDGVHPTAARSFHVFGSIVCEHAFFRIALGELQCPPKDRGLGFRDPKKAGAEKHAKRVPQLEAVDAVLAERPYRRIREKNRRAVVVVLPVTVVYEKPLEPPVTAAPNAYGFLLKRARLPR